MEEAAVNETTPDGGDDEGDNTNAWIFPSDRVSTPWYLIEVFAYAEKGVPAFWLTAMKNNEVLAEEVSSFGSAVYFFYNVHFCDEVSF